MASWEDSYRESLRQRPSAPANNPAGAQPVADWQRNMGAPRIVADAATTERRAPNPGDPWVQGGTQQQWNAIPTAGAASPTQQPTAQPATPTGPWGTFGSYDNWAQQFAGQHGGRVPNKQDEADFFDSQMFANQYGRGPSYGEWINRWHTGEWNKGMPWQLQAGTPYYGAPFESMRGTATSPAYQRAVMNPGALPPWLQQSFVPWYQQLMGGGGAPQAQPQPAAPQVPQMSEKVAEPEWWMRGPGIVGRR